MSRRGEFGGNGGEYSCNVVLSFDDPLNPFQHAYHPDHDNLDARFAQKLPEGRESFTVSRQLQIQFTETDPANLGLAGWGDTQLGGVYQETIVGLPQESSVPAGDCSAASGIARAVLNQ